MSVPSILIRTVAGLLVVSSLFVVLKAERNGHREFFGNDDDAEFLLTGLAEGFRLVEDISVVLPAQGKITTAHEFERR